MQAESTGRRRLDPAVRIAAWTFGVGGVSFAAGFIGPMYFSTANLGPLLGVFVTGPREQGTLEHLPTPGVQPEGYAAYLGASRAGTNARKLGAC